MGCDIHINLEYRDSTGNMEPVIANFFTVTRDYSLFSALAGVRSGDNVPKYSPRGIPENCCDEIFFQYFTEILPDDATDSDKDSESEWILESKLKQYKEDFNKHVVLRHSSRYIDYSDFHTPSFLNLKEIFTALSEHDLSIDELSDEFQMLTEFMKTIDSKYGQGSSRIIFWFDN